MKRFLVLYFWLLSLPFYAQTKLSNNNYGFFDLMKIENNHFHHQAQVSASLDEFGWNGELYKIKKNFISWNFAASYKRLLPNIPPLWTPNTFQNIDLFPQNGIMLGFGGRWFFNQRKFSYAGAKISTGYLWAKDKEVLEYITFSSTSNQRYYIFNVDDFRVGFDLIAGRKFVNKFISDITVEAGYRFDQSEMTYMYQSSGPIPSDEIVSEFKYLGFYHFQIRLGFDIFSK